MAHDFAKTRAKKAPAQKHPEPAPQPARGMLITGLLTGVVLGFFSFFLIYLSGILPPIGSMIADVPDADDAAELAAAQQRRTEELEQAAARLQLEFYKELPNYEVVVDSAPDTSTPTDRNAISATAAAIANAAAIASVEAAAALTTATVDADTALTTGGSTASAGLDNISTVPSDPLTTTGQIDATASSAVTAPAPAPGEPAFMIQAGAFQQEAAAVAQSMRLNALGLDAQVKKEALLGKTLFLVQAGPYFSREQLNQAERVLRSNSIDSMRIGLSQ